MMQEALARILIQSVVTTLLGDPGQVTPVSFSGLFSQQNERGI